MTDQAAVDWPTCSQDGCIGIRLSDSTLCMAHASDPDRKAALQQLSQTGVIDARGVPISVSLLAEILAAAPHNNANHPTFAIGGLLSWGCLGSRRGRRRVSQSRCSR